MANIVQWDDPFAGLTNLHSQLDDMFDSMVRGMRTMPKPPNLPAMDVYSEDDKQLVAEVSAPGFTKDDIEVNVHNNVLEIKGEKSQKDNTGGKKRSYMMRESYTSFYRRIALPDYADADKVDAEFHDGVLRVTVPFKALPKPKRIAIAEGTKKK